MKKFEDVGDGVTCTPEFSEYSENTITRGITQHRDKLLCVSTLIKRVLNCVCIGLYSENKKFIPTVRKRTFSCTYKKITVLTFYDYSFTIKENGTLIQHFNVLKHVKDIHYSIFFIGVKPERKEHEKRYYYHNQKQ